MTDRHIQVSAFPDGLPVAARSPVWLGASLGYAVERAGRQFTAWGLGGFGAVIGGLVLFSPLIDGGTTQLPVFIIRLVVLVSAVIWLLGRTKEGELFLPQTRLDVCVALFAWWAALSLLWSPYKNASLQWVLSILFLCRIVRHGHARHSIADEDLDAGPGGDGHWRLRRSLGIDSVSVDG